MHFRCLFWRGGSTFRRLGKGHRIVPDKALCVRMSPVSLEPRRCNKNKIKTIDSFNMPAHGWDGDGGGGGHKTSPVTPGVRSLLGDLRSRKSFMAQVATLGTMPLATVVKLNATLRIGFLEPSRKQAGFWEPLRGSRLGEGTDQC